MRDPFNKKANQELDTRDKIAIGAILIIPALAISIYLAASGKGAEVMRSLSCWSPIKGFNGETLCKTTGPWNTNKNPTIIPTTL